MIWDKEDGGLNLSPGGKEVDWGLESVWLCDWLHVRDEEEGRNLIWRLHGGAIHLSSHGNLGFCACFYPFRVKRKPSLHNWMVSSGRSPSQNA